MKWKITDSKSKLIINKAQEWLRPVVTLTSGLSEIIVTKEQDVYTLYIKNDDNFAYYQPLSYWMEDAILAVSEYSE